MFPPGWTQDRNELCSHCPPAPDQRISPTLPAMRATSLPCLGIRLPSRCSSQIPWLSTLLPPLLTPPNLSVHTSGHPEPGTTLAAHALVSEGPSGPCSSFRSATSGLPSRREVALSLGWTPPGMSFRVLNLHWWKLISSDASAVCLTA